MQYRDLFYDFDEESQSVEKKIFALNYGTAKARIQNQLSYKLGLAVMLNSKSLFGCIRMPFTIWRIARKHQKELKAYQKETSKDIFLKLPPLESYPDYKEALKEKECLAYKIGKGLIEANNTSFIGGGGGVYWHII